MLSYSKLDLLVMEYNVLIEDYALSSNFQEN